MKLKLISAAMLAAIAFTACSDKNKEEPTFEDAKGVAYLSLQVLTPSAPEVRASTETQASEAENAVKTLKAIVFNSSYEVIKHSTVTDAVQTLTGFGNTGQNTTENTNAFKVPGQSKYLLLIANPGTQLDAVLAGVSAGMHFNSINNAITGVNVSEIMDATKGFAMINAGIGVALGDVDNSSAAFQCLVDLSGKVQVVADGEDPAIAKAAAEASRVPVKIERLSSKVEVAEKAGGVGYDAVKNPDAKFTFTSWILDLTNTTFYPWAKKVDLASAPGNSSFYAKNFYTVDPNYESTTGLTRNPITVTFPTGADIAKAVYCIENTMKASAQQNDKATRAVVKAAYYPQKTWTAASDWYSYSGAFYETLEILQDAYNADPANPNLVSACNRFFAKVKAANGTAITAVNFAALTQAMLDNMGITNGGELVKEDDCIRWYQKGLCYYYFPVRHDESITANSAFAKYGVVRNNWYACTITKVSEPGTPWYPEIDDDDIDETEGYISATITTGPWVKWGHDIEL